MNVLSQCLKLGQYPRTMIVSEKQASSIIEAFYTDWKSPPSTFVDLNDYAAYFYAYYNTKRGENKRCFIKMEK